MNTPREPRFEQPRMRQSTKVALVLLGTAGVVGGAMIWDAWRTEREAQQAPAAPPPEPLATDRTYANNHYVPGAGYYHAPFFSWFPFPMNYHDPARGYFSGGQWRASPFASDIQQSRPSAAAVSSATAAQRAHVSSFARSGSPSTSRPSVIRGGFGSSSHGSSGGAS